MATPKPQSKEIKQQGLTISDMADQQSNRPPTWHDYVDIKEYFEKMIEDLRRYYDARLEAIAENTCRAAHLMDKRLDGMNEFREALKDTQSKAVSSNECKVMMSRHDEDLRMLRESKAMLEGKASQNSVILAIVLAVAGIILGVFERFM